MVYYFLYKLLDTFFQALYIALLVRVLLSWVPHNHYNPIINFIYRVTDPILGPFQDIIPSYRFGIDLSPILAFIAIAIVRKILFQLLF